MGDVRLLRRVWLAWANRCNLYMDEPPPLAELHPDDSDSNPGESPQFDDASSDDEDPDERLFELLRARRNAGMDGHVSLAGLARAADDRAGVGPDSDDEEAALLYSRWLLEWKMIHCSQA